MAEPIFWARRPLTYNGVEYDRGEVLRMAGCLNDEKLLRLGYIAELKDKKPTFSECGYCHKKFVEMRARDGHGRKRHERPAVGPADLTPARAGEIIEDLGRDVRSGFRGGAEPDHDEQAQLETEAPLYLDKTSASRGVHP